eukprot:CAMPEP_0119043422 /NCGR_PEP_ID=MMETSP1177-20130426/21699_1 /TAXON_ID=2985 /ORGANISM="Ochromonas sp, Strain CCMP1899" /LENGTH=402 /DNA_ID=CAMNT_0007011449 /DNA_START=195 /DNA_END=1403 /DNA_ORIENTATION=+
MNLIDFSNFHVPARLIAQSPATPRDSSRLMVIRRETGTIEHHFFRDLPKLLDPSYLIVMNNSKVINCKLTPTYYDTPLLADQELEQKLNTQGKSLVVYLLKQLSPDRWLVSGDDELESKSVGFQVFISQPESNVDTRIIVGTLVEIDNGSLEMVFRFVDRNSSSVSSSDQHSDQNSLKVALLAAAFIPLPPYIEAENAIKVADKSYQTVYASEDGSVAAPTAGLHFTSEVFSGLAAKGVKKEEITLHVGYGTFGHVTENDLSKHNMHSEVYDLNEQVTNAINSHKKKSKQNKILTVGTTSTRVLESCANLIDKFKTDDSNTNGKNTSKYELFSGTGETNIFIYPPYEYKMVDALLTNFHMPGLTPIMLVSAFAGHELTMKAYQEAVKEEYRFYSFGDSMLIL